MKAATVSWVAPWTVIGNHFHESLSKRVLKYVFNISIKKPIKYFSIRLTMVLHLMVKKYTVCFDIIAVVGPRILNLNFFKLSLQEEFHAFNLYLNKECKVVQILENYLKTIPFPLSLLAVIGKKEWASQHHGGRAVNVLSAKLH